LVSVGNILLKAITNEGWFLFAQQDYESRIRGGHNFFRFRVANEPVYSGKIAADILVALDKHTVHMHKSEVSETSIVIYDPDILQEEFAEPNYLGIRLAQVVT